MSENNKDFSVKIKNQISDINSLLDTLNKTKKNELVNKIIENLTSSKGLIEELYYITAKTVELAKVGNKFVKQQKKGRAKKKIDMLQLETLAALGISNIKIAKIFDVSESTIRRRLKELDIQKNEYLKVKVDVKAEVKKSNAFVE